MLNISKEQNSQLAIIMVYVMVLIGSPFVIAAARADVGTQEAVRPIVVVEDPLADFKNAKSLETILRPVRGLRKPYLEQTNTTQCLSKRRGRP